VACVCAVVCVAALMGGGGGYTRAVRGTRAAARLPQVGVSLPGQLHGPARDHCHGLTLCHMFLGALARAWRRRQSYALLASGAFLDNKVTCSPLHATC
jgi:hypothetical protein